MRVLALALLFAATSAMADTPPPPAPAPGAPADTPPASIWKPTQDGGLEHLQSGLSCPGRFLRYHRSNALHYDDFGLDVSCNYAGEGADLTVYVTRRQTGDIAAAMTEAKRELTVGRAERHPQLLGDSQPVVGGVRFLKALYFLDQGLHSSIWIADLNGWTLEYRASYLINKEADAEADLGPLTALVQASAGARLAACAKALPPERAGVAVTDKQDLQQAALMASLMGSAAVLSALEHKTPALPAPASSPVFWCAEQPLKRDGHPLLFWRGIDAAGLDSGEDKVSLMTVGPPPSMELTPDRLGDLVRLAKDKNAASRWTASIGNEGKVSFYGFFAGRPSADAAADLYGAVVSGTAKALGGYSIDGKNINLTMPTDK